MTATTFGISRRNSRQLRLGAGVGSLTTIAVILSFVLLPHPRATPESERTARRTALVAWEASIEPLVRSGGEVVALGPRNAASQIQRHALALPAAREMARGWVRRLSQLQGQIAAVSTPGFLHPAHELLDEAMSGYVTASRRLLAAASTTGTRQLQLLEDAAKVGMAADHTYDRAVADIAHWRTELALPTDWSG